MSNYLKNPDDIYKLSFESILAETDLSLLPENIKVLEGLKERDAAEQGEVRPGMRDFK